MRHPHPPAPHSAVCSSPACSYTLYIIESSSFVFPVRCISHRSTLRQPVQHAAPVIAAHWLFLYPWFRVFLAAVSFCPRSLFHLCFLPGEISVPRLRMAVQSLLMYIQRLRMAIQRLQTEILASSFRNIIWLFEEVWAAG